MRPIRKTVRALSRSSVWRRSDRRLRAPRRTQPLPRWNVTRPHWSPTVVAHQLRFCRFLPKVDSDVGRVLAIEPESSKAEALRQIVRNDVGAEFVLVTSAYAAVVAINRQVPDLVLFSESISDRHRDRVLDHLKSVKGSGGTRTLSIPSLRNGDRSAFAAQIGAKLGTKIPARSPAPPPSRRVRGLRPRARR